jgi:hypothetical protein
VARLFYYAEEKWRSQQNVIASDQKNCWRIVQVTTMWMFC